MISVWPSAIFSSSALRAERNSERPCRFLTMLSISFFICDPTVFFIISTTNIGPQNHKLSELMEINAKERDYMRFCEVSFITEVGSHIIACSSTARYVLYGCGPPLPTPCLTRLGSTVSCSARRAAAAASSSASALAKASQP